jgi:C4-dicarboxylate-specific signal transduction histidine kinase
MKTNRPLKDIVREISQLTGSKWVVIALINDGKWTFANCSLPPKNTNWLLKVVNTDNYSKILKTLMKNNRIVQFDIEKKSDLGVGRFYIIPINENAGIFVGTDSLSPQTRKTWKVFSVVADTLLAEENQASQLQEALQELENLQQELLARVAAQQAAEARLIQTTKLAAVGEMAAGVAHELNNPLTTVVLFSCRSRKSDESNKCHRS